MNPSLRIRSPAFGGNILLLSACAAVLLMSTSLTIEGAPQSQITSDTAADFFANSDFLNNFDFGDGDGSAGSSNTGGLSFSANFGENVVAEESNYFRRIMGFFRLARGLLDSYFASLGNRRRRNRASKNDVTTFAPLTSSRANEVFGSLDNTNQADIGVDGSPIKETAEFRTSPGSVVDSKPLVADVGSSRSSSGLDFNHDIDANFQNGNSMSELESFQAFNEVRVDDTLPQHSSSSAFAAQRTPVFQSSPSTKSQLSFPTTSSITTPTFSTNSIFQSSTKGRNVFQDMRKAVRMRLNQIRPVRRTRNHTRQRLVIPDYLYRNVNTAPNSIPDFLQARGYKTSHDIRLLIIERAERMSLRQTRRTR